MEVSSMNVAQLRKRACQLGIKNANSYKKIDLIVIISDKVREVEKTTQKSKKQRVHKEVPTGTQSIGIYNMLIQHPSWSHYKVSKILDCTYTNVHRVYVLYVKGKFEDKRPTKNVQL